jgi:MinD superfamily P-loop ATPase
MEICVISGKGGTGKTTVAVNLALSCRGGTFLDCDVEEPDGKIFLLPRMERIESSFISIPVIDEKLCTFCGKCAEFCVFNALAVVKKKILFFERLCRGCSGCWLVCPEGAISEGKKETGVIRSGKVKELNFIEGSLNPGEETGHSIVYNMRKMIDKHDTVIIDGPPGLSPVLLEAVDKTDYAIIVTEPTPFGFHDLCLTVELLNELKVPYGVIINKDTGENSIEEYCQEKAIPLLLKIPFDMEIAKLYSRGIPFSMELPEWHDKFSNVLTYIVKYHWRKRNSSSVKWPYS